MILILRRKKLNLKQSPKLKLNPVIGWVDALGKYTGRTCRCCLDICTESLELRTKNWELKLEFEV